MLCEALFDGVNETPAACSEPDVAGVTGAAPPPRSPLEKCEAVGIEFSGRAPRGARIRTATAARTDGERDRLRIEEEAIR
jgi:hypothetical protein